jgi:acetyltransferase-like isoleucine patch superfamily enzyme
MISTKERFPNVEFFQLGFSCAKEPFIGNHCILSWGSLVDCAGQVTIEDYVFFGHRVFVLTGGHDYNLFNQERQDSILVKDVTIKTGAWIGTAAIVCPGVVIGEHSVVGAGAVVTKDVAPYTVVAGNPARFIRSIENPNV